MDAKPGQIILRLHGSKAVEGVELDGLEGFIENFRRALREYERSIAGGPEEAGRSGNPGVRSRLATGLRLVAFETGSGVAALEALPMDPSEQDELMGEEPQSLHYLRQMFERTSNGDGLTAPVIDALEKARKALGADGSYSAEAPADGFDEIVITESSIDELRRVEVEAVAAARDYTVIGRLHLIETESPPRIEIRTTDGLNWHCTIEADAKPAMLSMLESLVRAHGVGTITSPTRGEIHLDGIEPIPEIEQTELFTQERVPEARLEARHGIDGPQGLGALMDAEWVDDDAAREFLSIVSED